MKNKPHPLPFADLAAKLIAANQPLPEHVARGGLHIDLGFGAIPESLGLTLVRIDGEGFAFLGPNLEKHPVQPRFSNIIRAILKQKFPDEFRRATPVKERDHVGQTEQEATERYSPIV